MGGAKWLSCQPGCWGYHISDPRGRAAGKQQHVLREAQSLVGLMFGKQRHPADPAMAFGRFAWSTRDVEQTMR